MFGPSMSSAGAVLAYSSRAWQCAGSRGEYGAASRRPQLGRGRACAERASG